MVHMLLLLLKLLNRKAFMLPFLLLLSAIDRAGSFWSLPGRRRLYTRLFASRIESHRLIPARAVTQTLARPGKMHRRERSKRITTADDADMALALALSETTRERGSKAQVQHSIDGSALHSDSDVYTGQLHEHTGSLLCVWWLVPMSAKRETDSCC